MVQLYAIAGLQDYDGDALLAWTESHPTEDYHPIQYLQSLNKTFLFPPGKGGDYTGDGYVLLGLLLCAATGSQTWDQLEQKTASQTQSITSLHRSPLFRMAQHLNVRRVLHPAHWCRGSQPKHVRLWFGAGGPNQNTSPYAQGCDLS